MGHLWLGGAVLAPVGCPLSNKVSPSPMCGVRLLPLCAQAPSHKCSGTQYRPPTCTCSVLPFTPESPHSGGSISSLPRTQLLPAGTVPCAGSPCSSGLALVPLSMDMALMKTQRLSSRCSGTQQTLGRTGLATPALTGQGPLEHAHCGSRKAGGNSPAAFLPRRLLWLFLRMPRAVMGSSWQPLPRSG